MGNTFLTEEAISTLADRLVEEDEANFNMVLPGYIAFLTRAVPNSTGYWAVCMDAWGYHRNWVGESEAVARALTTNSFPHITVDVGCVGATNTRRFSQFRDAKIYASLGIDQRWPVPAISENVGGRFYWSFRGGVHRSGNQQITPLVTADGCVARSITAEPDQVGLFITYREALDYLNIDVPESELESRERDPGILTYGSMLVNAGTAGLSVQAGRVIGRRVVDTSTLSVATEGEVEEDESTLEDASLSRGATADGK